MTDEPGRSRPDDEDIDARFAEIVAGLTMSDHPEAPPRGGKAPRQPGVNPAFVDPVNPAFVDPRDKAPRTPRAGEDAAGGSADPPDDSAPPHTTPASPHTPAPPHTPTPPHSPTPPRSPAPEGVGDHPSSTWREWNDPEVEEHFVPPDPPPLPAGDLHFWGILIGLLGGPLILFLAHGLGVLHDPIWNWLGLGLALGGFGLLVLRLPTNRDDDPNGGARV